MKEENNVCLNKLESDSTYLSKPKIKGVRKTQEYISGALSNNPFNANQEKSRRKYSKTLDIFLEEVKPLHPTYDFSKVEYINNRTKVEVICKEHGSFFAQPKKLLKGCGCKQCYNARRGKSLKFNYAKFKKKLLEQDKGHLSIKDEDYKDIKSPLVFTCSIHGVQETNKAYNLIESIYGCPKCGLEEGARKSRVPYDIFLKKATKKFKGKFTYLEETYKGNSQKMKALCPKHGVIEILPYKHLGQEYGCYLCGVEDAERYSVYFDKPTTLYYIKLIKGDEEYFKLGITTTTLDKRFNKLPSDNVTYQIIATKTFPTGISAYHLEQHLLHKYKMNKIDFILLPKSGGNSEIFNQDIYESIKQYFD